MTLPPRCVRRACARSGHTGPRYLADRSTGLDCETAPRSNGPMQSSPIVAVGLLSLPEWENTRRSRTGNRTHRTTTDFGRVARPCVWPRSEQSARRRIVRRDKGRPLERLHGDASSRKFPQTLGHYGIATGSPVKTVRKPKAEQRLGRCRAGLLLATDVLARCKSAAISKPETVRRCATLPVPPCTRVMSPSLLGGQRVRRPKWTQSNGTPVQFSEITRNPLSSTTAI